MKSTTPQTIDRLPCLEGQTVTEIARVKSGSDHVFVVARITRSGGGEVVRVGKWLPTTNRWVFLDEYGVVWLRALDALRDEATRQRELQRT